MKNHKMLKSKTTLVALLLSTLSPQLSTGFAQGSLTPPGAPAPTMKTLDQIYARLDSRTPITNSATAVTISQPGSYYLTTNLAVTGGTAITIAASGVTLDLGGWTISSSAANATGDAIRLNSGLRDVTILNGHIRSGVTNNGSGTYSGPGFYNGITFYAPPPVNVLVSRVSVTGCKSTGIYLGTGDSTMVESCVVRTVGWTGIFACAIKDSIALDCGGSAIAGDQVSHCRGVSSDDGSGVTARIATDCWGTSESGTGVSAITALNCYGESATTFGVYANVANNCYGGSSSHYGLYATKTAQNCHGTSSTMTGLSATVAQNCYGVSNAGGNGINATVAHSCYGSSSSGSGIRVEELAVGCCGWSSSGTGLYAYMANACRGSSSSGTAQNITHKYDMP